MGVVTVVEVEVLKVVMAKWWKSFEYFSVMEGLKEARAGRIVFESNEAHVRMYNECLGWYPSFCVKWVGLFVFGEFG